jgi:hypothetical protein
MISSFSFFPLIQAKQGADSVSTKDSLMSRLSAARNHLVAEPTKFQTKSALRLVDL